MTDPSRYPAQVFWSDEDEGFIAIAPDLPGCSSFGESQAEALAELKPAIEAWIEAARAANNPIPEPSDPARRSQYSGKVLVRMPRMLHARLVSAAEVEEVSLNQYINYLLSTASAHMANQQYYSRTLPRSLQIAEFVTTYKVSFSNSLVVNTGREEVASLIRADVVHADVAQKLIAVTTERSRLEEQYG